MRFKSIFPVFLIVFFVVILLLNFFSRNPDVYPVLRLFAFVVSIGLGIISTIYAANAYGFGSEHGRALLFIAAGMVFILIGDLTFVFLQISGQEVPLPSVADLLYFLGYFFFVIGFFKEIRIYKVDIRSFDPFARVMVILFVLSIGAIVLYLEVFAQYDGGLSLIANLARNGYGVFDFFLLTLVVLILKITLGFGKGKLFLPWLLIFIGVISSMTGDVIYSLTFDKYLASVWPYTMLNVFWVGCYLLVSFGFIRIGNIIREAQAKFIK
jgi:hypothetical protein